MKGALVFGFNNQSVDYWSQANWCADRINRWLDLPVTIVTDDQSRVGRSSAHDVISIEAVAGGKRVYDPHNNDQPVDWYNGNRSLAWDISPYDQTLVIDSDYVVNSDQLLRLFDTGASILVMKKVYDITGRTGFKNYQKIGQGLSLHHYWATVIYFRKDQTSRDFFDLSSMIQKHYKHYSEIYQFPVTPFRNDFAASIALNTLYGHDPDLVPCIPWPMASTTVDVTVQQTTEDLFELRWSAEDRPRRVTVTGQDFHFMNKRSLAGLYETH